MKPDNTSVKGTLKCVYCAKTFKYDSERKRHEKSHSPQFECSVCAKKFSFQSALKRHEKQHKRTGNVKCEQCGGQFRDEILLKRHIQYAHKGEYTCSKCSSMFSSEVALRVHMKIHKPESERKFRCSFVNCGKSFNYSHHLKHHELTHTNQKQHFCDICNRGFIQSNHWKTHMKLHQPDKWLKCSVENCQKKFATKYAKKRHESTHKSGVDASLSIDSGTKDSTTSDSCEETVSGKPYVGLESKCIDKQDDASSDKDSCFSSLGDHYEDSDVKDDVESKSVVKENNVTTYTGVKDCTIAVGGCLMGSTGDRNNCLCAQMSTTVDEYYDLAPTENSQNKVDDLSKAILEPKESYTKSPISTNMCEGCDCANICSVPIRLKKIEPDIKTVQPVLDYKSDGTVKIKNTFDLDIIVNRFKEEKDDKSDTRMPYNSCKEVLGKCIVSGNGTMGEGCLCAKMLNDDLSMIAQELEEMLPRPKSDWQYKFLG